MKRRRNALCKEFFMEIKKTYNRFLSICLIVALGTAFFAGVRATNPDMQMSADAYFDESHLMDIRVLSGLGLTAEDAEAIRAIDGVKDAMPAYSKDVLAMKEDNQLVIKLMTATENVNLVTVDEGRMPEKPGECLADNLLITKQGYEIGDTITVMSGDDTAIEDVVTEQTMTIVGRGRLSSYLNLTRDSSQIGHGQVNGFLVLPESGFAMEAYTEIALTVAGAAELDCYSEAYEEKIAGIVSDIEAIAGERCQVRYDRVTADARKEIDDAKKEVADGEKELEDAGKEIEDGEKALAEARTEVSDGEKALADARNEVTDGFRQISDAKAELADGEKELTSGRREVEENEQKLSDGRRELEENEAKLAQARIQTEEGERQLAASEAVLEDEAQKLADGKAALLEGWETYHQQLEEAQNGLAQVKDYQQMLEAAAPELEKKRAEVAAGQEALAQMRPQIDAARTSVSEGEQAVNALNSQAEALDGQISELDKVIEACQAAIAGGDTSAADRLAEAQAGKAALEQSKSEISSQIQTIQAQLETAKAAIAAFEASEQQLAEGEKAIAEADLQAETLKNQRAALEEALAVTLPQAEQTLNEKQKEADAGEAALLEGRQKLAESKNQIEAARKEIEAGEAELAEGRKTLEDGEAQLLEGKRQIAANERLLAEAASEIKASETKLNDALAEIGENEQKLNDAKIEIQDGEKELQDGRKEYEEALDEHLPELEDARREIADAETALADVEVPEWYVLDRDYIQTCVEYAQDAERIGKIGDVFPVIFFLVAALVCLTTMTRMVEEERTQIGTLKALGYSKAAIAAKYVMYAFLATITGGVAGTIIGQKILPVVIMRAYSILYVTLTDYVSPLNIKYTVTALLAATASTIVAVLAACYKELLSVPAQLMRPVAPKVGRRVFLERVTFIWKHLNFSNKAAVRNLFRYKKRFFMTIIGIGGCMGLLMVGFGLKDSIMTICDRQFNDIRIYDSTISFDDRAKAAEQQTVFEDVQREENTSSAMMALEETVDVSSDASGRGERSAYLFVPSETDRMDEFIVLQDRASREKYHLDDNGAVISEKLAKLLEVSVGDEIYVEVSEMKRVPVKVTHIVENYYFHYVYVSPSVYETLYGKTAEYKEIFVKFKEPSTDYEEVFSRKYLAHENVSGISYTRTMSERISEMIRSMDAIIYVIIISAGLLAFVVLYNLNNINISERKRELATLKVLGFYDGEVSV